MAFAACSRHNFQLGCALLLVAGAALRVYAIGRALEYDELWTLEHYVTSPVGTIFRELATPNNHPLSSLLCKFSTELFGVSVITLRLPALLSGIAVLLLTIPVGLKLTRSRYLTLLLLFAAAGSAPLVFYSKLARGYELQLALLMGFVWALSTFGNGHSRFRWGAAGAAAGCAVAAILTLPTSILFLAPPLAMVLWKKKKDPAVWAVCVATGAFSLLWYLWNFSAFRAGQAFGSAVTSPAGLAIFIAVTLAGLAGFLAPFAVLGSFDPKRRKLVLCLWGTILFPLLMAVFTYAGGIRVYTPLIFPLMILTVMGVGLLPHLWRIRPVRYLAPGIFCGIIAIQLASAWRNREADLAEVFDQARRLPANVLPVYRGNEAVTAEWNNRPAITLDLMQRMLYDQPTPRYVLQMATEAGLNGLDSDGNEVTLPLAPPIDSRKLEQNTGWIREWKPAGEALPASGAVVAILPPQPVEELKKSGEALLKLWPTAVRLNQPILVPVRDDSGRVLMGRIFAVKTQDANWPEAGKLAGPGLRFFTVE